MRYLEPITIKKDEMLTIARERNKVLGTLRTSDPTPVDMEHQERWFYSMTNADKYYYIYNTCMDGQDVFVGYCGLDKINDVNKTAEISLLICEKHKGAGIGRSAVNILMDKAFNKLGINCVFGETYMTTTAWGFWQKIGFVYEGTLRDRKYFNHRFHDSTMFSMTKEQYDFLKKD